MDELYSMSLGGDDFVRKPYNMPILLARIAAVLKRSHPEMAVEKEVVYEDFSLCLSKGKLTKDGKSVELTRHELLILSYLFKHPQEIVSRVDLIEELWDNQVYIDDNTLSVNMTRLRSKLKTLGAENLIRTKYGQGYQL